MYKQQRCWALFCPACVLTLFWRDCTYHQLAGSNDPLGGGELEKKKWFLKLLWQQRRTMMNQMLVWFWIHRGPPLFAQKATVMWPEVLHQESNPCLGRTSFHSTSTCWWQSPGLNRTSDAKLSSTDCISKHSWLWKDCPKIIWTQRSPKSLLDYGYSHNCSASV